MFPFLTNVVYKHGTHYYNKGQYWSFLTPLFNFLTKDWVDPGGMTSDLKSLNLILFTKSLTKGRVQDGATQCPVTQCPGDPVPRRPSAQATQCPVLELFRKVTNRIRETGIRTLYI
jgi:hypothetical protein